MQRIVCHGDSLTEGADLAQSNRWPSLLGTHLGIDVLNTGIGGDTTAGMLSRFPADVLANKPDIVILTGGTNDLWWDLPLKFIVSNLLTMVYQAQYYGIIPLLGLPMGFDIEQTSKLPESPPEAGYLKLFSNIEKLVYKLKRIAKEGEIDTVDYHDLFMNDQEHIYSTYFLEDGVHPNQEGHQQMAHLAAEVISSKILG